ncbi:MAG: hypothetical protein H7Z10_11985 [Gemmatimonadaceae bacterium]|nr:hypothetical protein [Acetobacteraceae bacterium]
MRLGSLPSFVTTRGGGYFFMPGRQLVGYLAGSTVIAPRFETDPDGHDRAAAYQDAMESAGEGDLAPRQGIVS